MYFHYARFLILLSAIFCCHNLSWAKDNLLSEKQFRDLVISKIKEIDENHCFKVLEPSYFSMSEKGGSCEDSKVSTLNTFSTYTSTPEDLDYIIDRFVRVAILAEEQEDSEIDKSQLSVILRHENYLETIELGLENGQNYYYKRHAGDLLAIVAINSPESLALAFA